MKAFLLAGGRGERLRPFTLTAPKCLVPVDGRPILGHWLDLCAEEGITDILVNVSHHAEQVERFLANQAARLGVRTRLVVEPCPMGSATSVLNHRSFVDGDECFWILYADTLVSGPLAPVLRLHQQRDAVLTLGLFRARDPRSAGIVDLDMDGRIVAFREKPAEPISDLASAGVYVASPRLFDQMPAVREGLDFGMDVLPGLVGLMYGRLLDGVVQDAGTAEGWQRADAEWRSHRLAER